MDYASLFSLDFNVFQWILLISPWAAALVGGLLLWPRLRRVCKRCRTDASAPLPPDESYPPCSVVVYAQGDGENLRTLLPQILEQDYPAPFEVVVVNDQSSDNTEAVVSELEMQYHNLYLTFAPDDTAKLSRRKLSITLGIKAARHDVLVHTTGNCRISSPMWLRMMMRHIVQGREVVIGYAAPAGPEGTADIDHQARSRAFDVTWSAVRYLSSAIAGCPWRATGENLVYTKRLFYNRKGFSHTLHLQYGDDDIFIHEIANGHNTAVELGDDAILTATEHSPLRNHRAYAIRRLFTSRYLPRKPFVAMGIALIAEWLLIASVVVATMVCLPSVIGAASAVLALTAWSITTATMWKRTSALLHSRPMGLVAVGLMLTRPWRALCNAVRTRRESISQVTNKLRPV